MKWVPTPATAGPWSPLTMHGGPSAALLARAATEAAPGGALTRIAVQLLRPVPIGPLATVTRVLRASRRVIFVECALVTSDDVSVAAARAVLVRTGEGGAHRLADGVLPAPESCQPALWTSPTAAPALTDVVETRMIRGAVGSPGPAAAWFRLRTDLFEDRPASAAETAVLFADFANGLSNPLDIDTHTFVNPDLDVLFAHEPRGRWVALDAAATVSTRTGRGAVTGTLADEDGSFATVGQTLVIAARRPGHLAATPTGDNR